MVTVVDAVNFLKDYDEAKYLQDTGESLGEEDERSVADLLVDQVEFADVLLISKTDLVDKQDVERLTAILKTLNTDAQVIPMAHGKIAIDEVLNTGLFDFNRAQQAPAGSKRCVASMCPKLMSMVLAVLLMWHVGHFILKDFIIFYITPSSTES